MKLNPTVSAAALAKAIAKELWRPVWWLCLLYAVLDVRHCAHDDTDPPGGGRSGLRLLTDSGTGVQYLSDGHGGLVPRQPKPKAESP